jgi:hypothetical protein
VGDGDRSNGQHEHLERLTHVAMSIVARGQHERVAPRSPVDQCKTESFISVKVAALLA